MACHFMKVNFSEKHFDNQFQNMKILWLLESNLTNFLLESFLAKLHVNDLTDYASYMWPAVLTLDESKL